MLFVSVKKGGQATATNGQATEPARVIVSSQVEVARGEVDELESVAREENRYSCRREEERTSQ